MDKKKILIVDDEKDFAELVKLNLEATGKYQVRTENMGSRGYAAAREFKPDLVLLDILMPDMEGSDVAARLNNESDTKNIPIIFITAVISKEEAETREGVIAGHSFISKPVDIKRLIGMIDKKIR